MEEDIIDQLYFGRIVPWERQVEKPPEIEQCSDQVCEDIECLQKSLDEVGKKVLERFLDNNSEVEQFQVKESFKYGFRLGMQLAAAGLEKSTINMESSNWRGNDMDDTSAYICSRCGQTYYEPPALSREDNQTLICPDCGTREALESIGVDRKEQEEILAIIHQSRRNL
nr:MAG TPA: DNA-directed RNA polymerase II subunit [Caudoviricetes sp.]